MWPFKRKKDKDKGKGAPCPICGSRNTVLSDNFERFEGRLNYPNANLEFPLTLRCKDCNNVFEVK